MTKKELEADYFSIPREIIAQVYDDKKRPLKKYYYRNFTNAIQRVQLHAVFLQVGYTIQLTHALTSAWIADVKVNKLGKITTTYVWDDPIVVKSREEKPVKKGKVK